MLSNDNINFFSICASIILLVISLHVPSRKYGDISHKFHSCGRDINILYDKVCYWKNNPETVNHDQIKELIDEYNLILKNYDINHSTLDFSVFKCSNYKDYFEKFPTWFYFKTYVMYFLSYYLLYCVAIIFPIVIFFSLMN
ncbi:SLATT domain-containing protein [Flavobacterium sp. YO12]|uniref:SLATT domain-containing protein n=1 Tax=Flavobacterium sp. YO12 TaxID=1920029 RepID=UPI00352A6B49